MVDGMVLAAVALPYIIMGKGKEVESGSYVHCTKLIV